MMIQMLENKVEQWQEWHWIHTGAAGQEYAAFQWPSTPTFDEKGAPHKEHGKDLVAKDKPAMPQDAKGTAQKVLHKTAPIAGAASTTGKGDDGKHRTSADKAMMHGQWQARQVILV